MTPTPTQIAEWRESGCNAFILDSEVSLGTCGAQAYVYGYIRARTEQATEIAELKAKLAEVMPPAKFGAEVLQDAIQRAYYDLSGVCVVAAKLDLLTDLGVIPLAVEATVEQLLKD